MKKYKKISAVMSFMFIFSILLPRSIAVQAMVSDNTAPIVKSVSVNKTGVKVGSTVVVTVEAEDNASGLAQEANLCYITETGEIEKGITLPLVDGKYVGEINIDDTYTLGTWKVGFITVEDNENNVSIVYNLRVYKSIGSFSATMMDLNDGTFDVMDTEDINAPGFVKISVDHNQIQKYDNIKIAIEAVDDLSGLAEEANLCYVSKDRNEVVEKEISLSLVNGVYEGNINIDDSYAIGNWAVNFITLQDNESNVSVIYNSEVHPGLGINLSLGDLYSNEDIATPKLNGISVEQVNGKEASDKFIVKVQASDDMSGLAEEANLCYVLQQDGKDIEKEVTLTLENGQYISELNVDDSFIVGVWKVSFITLQDKANNVAVIYNSKVHKDMGTDLSAGDISLSSDIAGPIFQGISVSENILNLYENVIIEVEATDNSDLAEEANLCYVSEVDAKVLEKEVTLKLENGKYVGKLSVDETYGAETWKVSFITLQDKAENVTIVYNSSVHEGLGVDLSSADLRLNLDGGNIIFNSVTVTSKNASQGDKIGIMLDVSDSVPLKETANLCYVLRTPLGDLEKEVTLDKLEEGRYLGFIDVDKTFVTGLWQISFITVEDINGNVLVVYNNKVHEGIGMDLSAGNINSLNGLLIEAPLVEGLNLGNTAKVSVKASNGLIKAQDVTLIVGIYDNNNRLIEYVATTPYSLTCGESIQLKSEIKIPITGKYKLKVFVWDSIEGMTPLSDTTEYTVE